MAAFLAFTWFLQAASAAWNIACADENAVICAILKQCTVFKDMSPSDLTDIAQKMEQEDFTPGTDIIRQGEIGDKFYVIAKGRAQIITASTTDVSRPVILIKEGAFFGEVALLRDQPRNATVRAQESVTTYTLSKENFLAAVRAHKSFEEQLATQLFHRG